MASSRRRVLVVEDDADCRLAVTTSIGIRDHLELAGMASTGETALQLVGELAPDIVVLDLRLPDISGLDLIPAIRECAPATRIVVFSGSTDTATIAAVERTGADRYVTKAGSVVRLLDVLDELPSTREAGLTVRQRPEEVRAGRRFVTTWAARWGYDDRVDALEIVSSELITNAITHAESAATVQLIDTGQSLRLEVHDRASLPPAPVPPDDESEHGRGLHIVAALADAWGIDTVADGKIVWAEFLATRE